MKSPHLAARALNLSARTPRLMWRCFLALCGKEVPCESSAQKQETFVSELSEIIVGMDKTSVIYCADGVHPTHHSRSTYASIERGQEPEQPTVSGRDSVNINGLLNAGDVTDVIAHECESVNAESTKTLYQAALDKHPQAECIYIISDNAKYCRKKTLTQWPEGTGIRQIYSCLHIRLT